MGGLLSEYVDEARSLGSQILDALIEGNRQREKAAKEKPPARALTKMNVVSEAQLRTVAFQANVDVPIFAIPAGQYVKINHWTADVSQEAGGGIVRLYYGPTAELKAILDASPSSEFPLANPNELIVPPQNYVFVRSTKPGIITLSITSYELHL